jgi:hypothetical protein
MSTIANTSIFVETPRESITQKFLAEFSALPLQELITKYELYTCKHPTEPIIILNYSRISDKKCEVTNVCRGLVVETVEPFRIVSRGFDRFSYYDPIQKPNSNPEVIETVTVKEDGSLIFLFKYNSVWHLSTMHNFADDLLPQRTDINDKQTYAQLFVQIIGMSLNDFGNKLESEYNTIDNVMTFCFEMCSLKNRVVKKYDPPTLILLGVFGNEHGATELPIVPNIFTNIKNILSKKIIYEKEKENEGENISYNYLSTMLQKYCKSDMMFEGFVIQTKHNQRYKIKNPYYIIHHNLKYRSWSHATPQLIVPLILENTSDLVIGNVLDSVGNNPNIELELKARHTFYKERLSSEFRTVLAFVNDLFFANNNTSSISSESKVQYLNNAKAKNTVLYKRWLPLLSEIYTFKSTTQSLEKLEKTLYELYSSHIIKKIPKLFPTDPFIDSNHKNSYCKFDLNANHVKKNIGEKNNGLAQSTDLCFCGAKMVLTRLKYDLLRYKVCHCGVNIGIHRYNSGILLYICASPKCLCTHEINQLTALPLGITASIFCKSLRMYIHELINLKIKAKLSTRDESYKTIANIINKTENDTHMAKLGITDCINIILNY